MTEKKQNEKTEKAYKAFENFIKLCRLLFNHKDDGSDKAKKINELIGKDSEFYNAAVSLAAECEMSWDNLTPEDSDELQLIMLDDYYNSIRTEDDYEYALNISIRKKSDSKKNS